VTQAAPVAVGRSPVAIGRRTLAREQVLVAGAQLVAGAGNLVYALVMARVLAPRAFTHLAAFLAVYLLLHLPAAGLGAGGAVAGNAVGVLRRRALGAGLAAGAAGMVAAPWLADLLRVPVTLPLLLAVAAPGAALLALERGRLYGAGAHSQAATSLLVEPVARLAAGLALAQVAGAPGAAAGVVLGGYAALLVTRNPIAADAPTAANTGPTRAAVGAFILLAVVQNQDLLLAARLLSPGQAARFAALSTIGGIAAFATATVPLVLLPRAAANPRARGIALAFAAALGGGAVAVFAVASGPLVELVFGDRYASIAPLAAPYVLGMSVLGVARVLAADAVAKGRGPLVIATTAALAAVQAVLVVRVGTSAGAVAAVTIGTTVALALALTAVTVVRFPVRRPPVFALLDRVRTVDWGVPLTVAGLTAFALVLRLVVTRGLWVDEAISVSQAHLPFGAMIDRLAQVDVHPPLHAAVLWVMVRAFGDGELAVRLPSIVAGVALVPLLFATGRELFDRKTGLIAAALGAVSPLAVWYSQEARMYSLYMAFALLAVYAQARALRRNRAGDWALYAIATAALVWTQYFAVLVVAAQQIVFIAAWWRRRGRGEPVAPLARRWLLALVVAGVLVLPLAPYFADQWVAYAGRGAGLSEVPAQAGNAASEAQSGLSVYAVIANLIWATFGYHADNTMAQIAALWPLGMLGALLVLGRRRSPAAGGLLVVTAVPMLALFLIGLQRRDLFELRYIAAAVPLLLLLGARAITAVRTRRGWTPIVAALVLVALLGGALADQQLNGTNPRLYDFRGALQEVSARAERGDVILYSPHYLDEVVSYYAPGVDARPIGEERPGTGSGRVFVLGSFLDQRETAKATGAALGELEQDRPVVDEFEVPQVRVWVFGPVAGADDEPEAISAPATEPEQSR
jgi:hypothetical protein